MSQTSTNTEAHQVLQAAHNRTYHYPEDFRGFKAKLRYSIDEKTREGQVAIHSPNDIMLEIEGTEGELKTLQQEISSLCGHRWHAPYNTGDGRYTLSLDENAEHPLGQLVTFQDDPFQSSYRIKNGTLVQVNRQMGPTRFTIYMQELVRVEGDRELPRHFTVTFWDTQQKRLMRTVVYTDQYVPVGGYYLPASRQLVFYNDEGISTHALVFSAHELI